MMFSYWLNNLTARQQIKLVSRFMRCPRREVRKKLIRMGFNELVQKEKPTGLSFLDYLKLIWR